MSENAEENINTQVFWVVIAISCQDCGSLQAVGLFKDQPSEEEKASVADRIGGMYCIRVSEIEINAGDTARIDSE
jgi:hypothetical protein